MNVPSKQEIEEWHLIDQLRVYKQLNTIIEKAKHTKYFVCKYCGKRHYAGKEDEWCMWYD
jgi:hypothetical protein